MTGTAEMGGGMWEEPDQNADEHLWKPDFGSAHIPPPTSAQ
jgi:hypothetical protein